MSEHLDYYLDAVDCEDPAEFLDVLSPLGPHFRSEEPDSFLFRGHANADWKLEPSVLRDGSKELCELLRRPCDTTPRHVVAELKLLWLFYNRVNASGLAVPEDSVLVRDWLDDHENVMNRISVASTDHHFPFAFLMPLIALARHHRLPTRLVDWTYNPFKAAYFAVADAVENRDKAGERIAVWALRAKAVSPLRQVPALRLPFHLVSVPTASNPNLGAQEGAFTVSTIDLFDKRPGPTDLVALLEGHDPRGLHSYWKMLRRVSVPVNDAPQLLWMLAKLRITAATVFPNYDGAANAVKERRRWLSLAETKQPDSE